MSEGGLEVRTFNLNLLTRSGMGTRLGGFLFIAVQTNKKLCFADIDPHQHKNLL